MPDEPIDLHFTQRLPHNLEAERALVGELLRGADAYLILSSLEPDDFYSRSERLIFEAAKTIHLSDTGPEKVNLVPIIDFMRNEKTLDEVKGVDSQGNPRAGEGWLKALHIDAYSSLDTESAIRSVKENSFRRRTITGLIEIAEYTFSMDFADTLSTLNDFTAGLADGVYSKDNDSLSAAVDAFLERMKNPDSKEGRPY